MEKPNGQRAILGRQGIFLEQSHKPSLNWRGRGKLMQDKMIAKIEVTLVTDDSTVCYRVGELDFGVGGWVSDWFEKNPKERENVAGWLEWLAKQCRAKEAPFGELK